MANKLAQSLVPKNKSPNWMGLTYVLPDIPQTPLLTLSPEQERQFQSEMQNAPWFKELAKFQGGINPNLNDPNYDYRRAWKLGVQPQRSPVDNFYHWGDAAPTGEWLKSPNHPTAWANPFINQFGINPDDLPPTDPRIISFSKQWHQKYPPNYGNQNINSQYQGK